MSLDSLQDVARALVAPGKGILAADESSGTIKKRFDSINLESTAATRRAYRDLLFTAAEVDNYFSGVILFDETLRQDSLAGKSFPRLLTERGILPGIKVDMGAKALAGAAGEKVTEGLDGLRERCAEYRSLGARFAKWRAVITIGGDKQGKTIPSDYCLEANAHSLARYAALSLEQDLVPIVEPEVLMDGGHSIERCEEVTERILARVFAALRQQRVPLEQILLKPNMVLSGSDCPRQANVAQVAEATVRCFRRHVPAAVAGIVFLSGGQPDIVATAHLGEMNRRFELPWELSFSYGRALQAPALAAWQGQPEKVAEAQQALQHRAKLNSAARAGSYSETMETAAAAS